MPSVNTKCWFYVAYILGLEHVQIQQQIANRGLGRWTGLIHPVEKNIAKNEKYQKNDNAFYCTFQNAIGNFDIVKNKFATVSSHIAQQHNHFFLLHWRNTCAEKIARTPSCLAWLGWAAHGASEQSQKFFALPFQNTVLVFIRAIYQRNIWRHWKLSNSEKVVRFH